MQYNNMSNMAYRPVLVTRLFSLFLITSQSNEGIGNGKQIELWVGFLIFFLKLIRVDQMFLLHFSIVSGM